ncbi:nuclear transport factor 2 family protein [Arthrobacter liuii]|nr:nuclear transport factor 2 family protein [Arthrobacter liuii]
MGSQEDAALVRRGYEAFIAGDMDTLRELFADDIVWHAAGTGELAGDKKGPDAVLAYFGELASRATGSLKVTLEDVAPGDRYTVGIQSNHAERNGRTLDQRQVVVFSISDGKVTEAREMLEDTALGADFWS